MGIPEKAAEALHWTLGKEEIVRRAKSVGSTGTDNDKLSKSG